MPMQGQVKPDTMASYLSALRSWHVDHEFSLAPFETPRMKLMLYLATASGKEQRNMLGTVECWMKISKSWAAGVATASALLCGLHTNSIQSQHELSDGPPCSSTTSVIHLIFSYSTFFGHTVWPVPQAASSQELRGFQLPLSQRGLSWLTRSLSITGPPSIPDACFRNYT